MAYINVSDISSLNRKLSTKSNNCVKKLSNSELVNIHGGIEFNEDFLWGSIAGGALYDVVKGATIGTAEFIGDNVYELWSPADGGFLF